MTTAEVLRFPERDDPQFELHDRIRKIRRTTGLTQPQFAATLHITVKALDSYESGRRTPPPEKLAEIANRVHRLYGYRRGFLTDAPIGRGPEDHPRTDPKPVTTAYKSHGLGARSFRVVGAEAA